MYKNLIFDVGGVLLSYRWEYAVADSGIDIEEARRICNNLFDDELWTEFDLGNLDYDYIIDRYCEKYPDDAYPIRYFLEHTENMFIERPNVWKELQTLKEKGYNIYLLSNYSERMFKSHTDGKEFWKYVDGALVSYMVHVVKPDIKIYEELLKRFDLKASESLFFDDRKENTDAAKACGIDAVTVHSEEMLISELKKL